MTSARLKGLLIIAALLQIVWGLVPSASKFVIDEIPVELYIAIRWSISGAIFAVYVAATKSWRPVTVKDVGGVGLLGILGYGVASVATLYGLNVGGVTNFALMGAFGPAVTAGLAILLLKERPRPLFFVALPVSVLGLLLLVVGKYQVSSLSIAGISALFIVGGEFLEALVFLSSRRYKLRMSAAQYLAVAQISAAGLMWLLQGLVFHQTASLSNLSLKGLLAALFVSVVACVFCYAVLYWLLNYIDGHRLALFDGFHALSATLFGYFLFQENLTALMILGGIFILAGLVAGNLPTKVAAESPE